jgi:hypothetical protein
VFFKELQEVVPDYEQLVKMTDRPELVIPAQHPETGELHVWLDGDEVTVGIGEYFHTHFSIYDYSSDIRRDNEKEAAGKAVRFIQDVLADRVVFHVFSRSTGSYYRTSHNPPSLKPGDREFIWSGPFEREG